MGGPGGCERRIEVFVNIHKKMGGGVSWGGGQGVGSGEGWSGGQGRCEWGSEDFVKIQFIYYFFFGGGGCRVGGGGQGGCERRIEVFVKIQKKWGGGGSGRGGGWVGLGFRVDVNEELKFL